MPSRLYRFVPGTISSRSHRLPEHWVHSQEELAKLPHKAKQRQMPLDRVQVLEPHFGVMYPGMSSEGRTQPPRLANRNHLISAIVQQDDERSLNILEVI